MKKTILAIAIAGIIGLTSCNKPCYTCTGANINELNHDYCGKIYVEQKTDDAKAECELRGGVWAEKAK